MNKKTQEQFAKEVFELYGNEYSVIGEYIGNHKNIKMRHNCNDKDSHEFFTSPSNFLKGEECGVCYKKEKKTHQEFEKEIYELVSDEYVLLSKYITCKVKVKLKHVKCGTEFNTNPNSFLRGCRCPVCCIPTKRVVLGINSIYDTNMELFKMLLNQNDGYKYTEYSHIRVDWKCPQCGEIIKIDK